MIGQNGQCSAVVTRTSRVRLSELSEAPGVGHYVSGQREEFNSVLGALKLQESVNHVIVQDISFHLHVITLMY